MFEDVGTWKRARYYPQAGEDMHAAVARECRAVREAVGIFDGSTLGKIDLQGPDAAEFLERVYTNAWKGLEVGRCRYGLMLRDDGMVFDDGVTSRLGPDRFHMTTTTGGAARVMSWLEEWLQTEWPSLKVYATSVTEEWAVITLAGPKARDVLQAAGTDLDLSPLGFPHLTWQDGRIADVPARVFRVSFSGELSYEVNVPSGYGRHVWEALWAAGAPFGITPYGTEAMHVLRAEKGYIIVGQETDGTTTPYDLGMSWIVSKKKPDFIGKRGLARSGLQGSDRKQLVGLLTEDPMLVLEEGAQITATEGGPPPVPMLGHVTSSYMSPTLGRSIALALRPLRPRADGKPALRADARPCHPGPGGRSGVLRPRGAASPWLSPFRSGRSASRASSSCAATPRSATRPALSWAFPCRRTRCAPPSAPVRKHSG